MVHLFKVFMLDIEIELSLSHDTNLFMLDSGSDRIICTS